MIGRFLGAISLSNIASNKKYGLMIIVAIAAFFIIYGVTYLNTGVSFQEISPFLIFVVLNLLAFRLGNASPQRTLAIFAGIAMLLLFLVLVTSGKVAFWSVIAIGLFNSIMWSNVFTLAIDGLGKYTSQASSLLVMAILGGALVPVIQGALADAIGLQLSFVLPIFCYAYLMYYGIKGYKPRQLSTEILSENEKTINN